MKITLDVDCTPQEMRAFFGMPDVEPMQKAVMDELQRRMLASMDQISPTTIMKDWIAPVNAMQQAFLGAFGQAAAGAAGAAGSAGRAAGSARKRRATDSEKDA